MAMEARVGAMEARVEEVGGGGGDGGGGEDGAGNGGVLDGVLDGVRGSVLCGHRPSGCISAASVPAGPPRRVGCKYPSRIQPCSSDVLKGPCTPPRSSSYTHSSPSSS